MKYRHSILTTRSKDLTYITIYYQISIDIQSEHNYVILSGIIQRIICTVVVLYCFVMCVFVRVCVCVGFVMCVFVRVL